MAGSPPPKVAPVNPPLPPPLLPIGPKAKVKVKRRVHKGVSSVKAPSPFLPEKKSSSYTDYIRAETTGKVTPLINGRNSGGAGPDVDLVEPLDQMEALVRKLVKDDFVFLSAWFFEPATPLTSKTPYKGATTWGDMFAKKAEEGIKIKILINDFDQISGMDVSLKNKSLDPLKKVVESIPEADRNNFKYTVSMHPATVGAILSALAGQGFRKTHVGSHHQKFMIARTNDELTAFCGGLDIESRKTPASWSYIGLIGWHDIHFMLQGPIAYDLEGEFVQRWNREMGKSAKNPTIKGWLPYATLSPTAISAKDQVAAKKAHKVQMLRTVSVDGTLSFFDTKRDDILKAYQNVIHAATNYVYLENQYFRDQTIADKLAARAKVNTKLEAVFVVVFSAADDDGKNEVTEHGNYLQHLFFKKVTDAFKTRCRIYTMTQRAVHSKLMIVDDEIILGGSANVNSRGFQMDSELNIAVQDKALTANFRKRLWAHNLGTTEAAIANTANMLANFDKVAAANAALAKKAMSGEGIVKYDFTKVKGKKSDRIPDALAYMDFDDLKGQRGEGIDPDVKIV